MEHAEATVNLLESTQGAVNSNIILKMGMSDVDPEFKAQVDKMLGSYLQSCTSAGQTLKSDLHQMKESQEGMQKLIDDVAQGMAFVSKKSKAKAKKSVIEYESDSEEFHEELDDSFVDSSEDSDYQPTPKTTKRRRSKRLAKKEVLNAFSSSDDDKLFG